MDTMLIRALESLDHTPAVVRCVKRRHGAAPATRVDSAGRFASPVPMPAYTLNVNGREARIDSTDPAQPLLYVLRNALHLHGPKLGCGLGQCGACTVLVDGVATRSCTLPVSQVGARKVTTLEGIGT